MGQYLQNGFDALRYARWLTRERLVRWGSFCAFLTIGLLALDAAANTVNGITSVATEQLGRDFINYWSGALLVAAGHPEIAYDAGSYHAFQQSLVGPEMGWKIYSYAPTMMLLSRPLADLTFVHALFVWVLLGMAFSTWSLSRFIGWPMAALAMIGAPTAFWNLLSRQNGCFTAVLLVWGLTLVERRPLVAGILLGMLCYKPHLAILLPVALAAGGHWRPLAAAAAC